MKKSSMYIILFAAVFVVGCSTGPSDEAIKKKILLEYVCMETAAVENLKVIGKKQAETISDAKGYEYSVSGEVVWKEGCQEAIRPTPPGYREKFENKKVYLVETEGEWR